MNLKAISFNGNNINDGTNFDAIFPPGSVMSQADGQAAMSERLSNVPQFTRKAAQARNLPLVIFPKGVIGSQVDTLKGYFKTHDTDLRTLLAQDLVTSAYWTLDATPIAQSYNDGEFTVLLAVPDPIWKAQTESSDSWAITTSGSTHTTTVGGNIPTRPVITIKPTSGKAAGNGYTYRRFVTIENNTNNAARSYPLDVTGGGLDTAALVTALKCTSDGNDFRFVTDNEEQNRYLNDFDSTSSRMWANINLLPKRTVTLNGAIASTDTVNSISIKGSQLNQLTAQNIQSDRPAGLIKINSEIFYYGGMYTGDVNNMLFLQVVRAQRGTSAGTHADGDVITALSNDSWLVYGDTSLAAPSYSSDYEPAFTSSDSSNTSWVYTEFGANARLRSGAWKKSLISRRGKNSVVYTGAQGAMADPWTDMGTDVLSYAAGAVYRADTVTSSWSIFHPFGMTAIASTGEKFVSSTATWANKASLQYSADGAAWTTKWTETAPSAAATWEGWDQSAGGAFGAAYNYARFYIKGSCPANASGEIAFAVQTATITLDSTACPTVTVGAEQSDYHLKCVIDNETNGDSISLDFIMDLNGELEIDCENHTITYLTDGVNAINALAFPQTFEWFRLDPGANGLKFTDTGTGNVTMTINWYDRMS